MCVVDKNSELYGMSCYGAMLYLQEKEKEGLEPKKLELPEPVPNKEDVLKQIDRLALVLHDALHVRMALHERELMLEEVVTKLKTLQKGLHALLEDKSHEKEKL